MCLQGQAYELLELRDKLPRKLRDFELVGLADTPEDTLLGWRLWKVDYTGRLSSMWQSARWIPREACKTFPPSLTGEVGFHSCTTLDELLKGYPQELSKTNFKKNDLAVGQVLLWGKVAKHANGFRSEFAYPFAIHANGSELQNLIRKLYGCTVHRTFIPRLLEAA